jgi:hypothetical protein
MAVKKKAVPKPTAAMMRDVYLRLSFDSTEALIKEFDDVLGELVDGRREGPPTNIADAGKMVLRILGKVGTARDALAVARQQTGI